MGMIWICSLFRSTFLFHIVQEVGAKRETSEQHVSTFHHLRKFHVCSWRLYQVDFCQFDLIFKSLEFYKMY